MLLFLDFDGVTHGHIGGPLFNPINMDAIREAIYPYRPQIVLSTSWREVYKMDALEELVFSLGFPLIGATPVIEEPFVKFIRYKEILLWLEQNGHITTPWVALDDMHGLFPEHAPLYKVDGIVGFTPEDIPKFQRFVNTYIPGELIAG